MSLDQNLFTLIVTPNPENPNIVDLVDPSGTKHYRKELVAGSVYELKLFGWFSGIVTERKSR